MNELNALFFICSVWSIIAVLVFVTFNGFANKNEAIRFWEIVGKGYALLFIIWFVVISVNYFK